MAIIIPKKGQKTTWVREFDVDGNLDKYASQTAPPTNPVQPNIVNPNAQPLNGFIYVPSINLYVAKNRILQNKNWDYCNGKLQARGNRMPTIPEFVEFVKYLKANPNGVQDAPASEVNTILDEILTVRNPGRAEWLDAKFEDTNKGMHINYHGYDSSGQISDFKEQLPPYLGKDKTPGIDLESWLNNPTKHGLPSPNCKKGDLYYWYPRDGCAAGFGADSAGAFLSCGWNPTSSSPALGVRAIRRGSP